METWTQLGIVYRTRSILPNHGKPVVGSEFESATWLAEIMIWCTGEAELATVRLSDDRMVNKHYDLTGRDDLEALLDELVALLADDSIPAVRLSLSGRVIQSETVSRVGALSWRRLRDGRLMQMTKV